MILHLFLAQKFREIDFLVKNCTVCTLDELIWRKIILRVNKSIVFPQCGMEHSIEIAQKFMEIKVLL